MVVLGEVERRAGDDRCGDAACASLGFLCGVGAEHGVHVLAAVRAAAAAVCPDLVEELAVADQRRVEVDLEGLGVIGEVVIRRLDGAPAGVADTRANNCWVTPEPGVGRPESAQPEGRGLDRGLLQVKWKHRDQSTLPREEGYGQVLVAPRARACRIFSATPGRRLG